MNMQRRRLLATGASAALIVPLAGCGTILYPERKGQIDGRIDPGVAVLNGIGLLFFLVPGVIAFAVDFSNGTIYLPGTQTTSDSGTDVERYAYRGHLTEAQFDRIWQRHFGTAKPFRLEEAERHPVASKQAMLGRLKQLATTGYTST